MLEKIPSALGRALHGVRAGLEKTASEDAALRGVGTLSLTSADFDADGVLPSRCTADGEGVSPALAWSGAPAETVSVALVVEDADSPTPEPIVHLLAYDLPPEGELTAGVLSPDAPGAPGLGKNSFLKSGWLPPDPPSGHGPHRYVFQAFALSRRPELESGAGKEDVLEAIRASVLASGRLVGVYERR